MSIESTSTIDGLVATNPTPQDPVYQGPNHLWLIKSVLKNIFPGAGGQGFAKPITASEDELNRVKGVTSPLQTQINALQAQIDALGSGGGGGGGGTVAEQWPIGSIFHCALATNPATLLGFGTWSRFGQGKMLVSQLSSDPDFASAGSTGGSKTAKLLAHTHTATTSAASTSHTHTVGTAADHTHTAASGAMSANAVHGHVGSTGAMSANANHSHTATTNTTGSHTHMLSGILATAAVGGGTTDLTKYSTPGGLQTQYAGDHSHSVTVQSSNVDHTHTITANSTNIDHTHTVTVGAGGGHGHTITADSNSSHGHTVTVASAGEAAPSNMPPYVVVYMWQRVA